MGDFSVVLDSVIADIESNEVVKSMWSFLHVSFAILLLLYSSVLGQSKIEVAMMVWEECE